MDKQEIRNLAALARLDLSDAECESLEQDLTRIMGYVQKVQALSLDGLEPLAHVHGREGGTRQDKALPSLDPGQALEGAPEPEQGFFRVPRILEQ